MGDDYSASPGARKNAMACVDICSYIQSFTQSSERCSMKPTTRKSLLALGVLAGLMIGTGHIGGGLAVTVATGAGLWVARADAVRDDLR